MVDCLIGSYPLIVFVKCDSVFGTDLFTELKMEVVAAKEEEPLHDEDDDEEETKDAATFDDDE